jgi:hypothetical protein
MRTSRRGFLRGTVAGLLGMSLPAGLLGGEVRSRGISIGSGWIEKAVDRLMVFVTIFKVRDRDGRVGEYRADRWGAQNIHLMELGDSVWMHDPDVEGELIGEVISITQKWFPAGVNTDAE